MAVVQAAVFESVNAITRRYPQAGPEAEPAPGASIDAAVAAVNRAVLLAWRRRRGRDRGGVPGCARRMPEGQAKADGIALGEKAVAELIAACADRGAPVFYRPVTRPGMYVPTVVPAGADLPPGTLCWVLDRVDQFRPGPPPDLKSAVWARDYNEVKALGARTGSKRTAEQTEIARFWTATGPTIYFPIVRSVASQPGREVTHNARFLAVVRAGGVDAIDAVFDAKYHYHFWRPFTAIRNGDQDGNDATERDPSWLPFIETPMHPEYPCAHCTAAGGYGAVLHAEIGSGPAPRLRSTSPDAARRDPLVDQRRRLHAGGVERAHLRRRALPQLDRGRQRARPQGRRAGGGEADGLSAPATRRDGGPRSSRDRGSLSSGRRLERRPCGIRRA